MLHYLLSWRYLSSAFLRGGLLLMLAGLCGVGANLLPWHAIPWVGDWGHYLEAQAYRENIRLADYAAVSRLVEEGGGLLLDARSAADFNEGSIPGALSLPAEEVEQYMDVVGMLLPADQLVVYCSGQECDDALMLARWLREMNILQTQLSMPGAGPSGRQEE